MLNYRHAAQTGYATFHPVYEIHFRPPKFFRGLTTDKPHKDGKVIESSIRVETKEVEINLGLNSGGLLVDNSNVLWNQTGWINSTEKGSDGSVTRLRCASENGYQIATLSIHYRTRGSGCRLYS